MVVICTPNSEPSEHPDGFFSDELKMEKCLILLTPEFFSVNNNPVNAQFDDAPSATKTSQCPFLVPPTLEGLSLLSGSLSSHKESTSSAAAPETRAVTPVPKEKEQQMPKQLLPFKQSFAPFNGASLNSSYLSICQAQIPLGIFWDIENVRLPKNKSTAAFIEAIRQKFLVHYREAEFLVVCDAFKERKSLLMDLNGAQVTVVHVACTSKNAADDKLRQCMRRFIDNTGNPCAVMLISSDVNFSVDLSDFKNRKKIHVILLHGVLASEALLLSSNEHYLVDQLIEQVPSTPQNKVPITNPVCLDVTNLPMCVSEILVRQRLEQIAENCGGKVIELHKHRGVIRFTSPSAAERALLRMKGEDVFGNKISLQKSNHVESTCHKQSDHLPKRSSFPPPPNPANVAPPTLLAFTKRANTVSLYSTPKNVSSNCNQRPLYGPSLSCQSTGKSFTRRLPSESDNRRVISESSEDDRREHNSSDEVSPQPLSSDYDEEHERPEKEFETFKTLESSPFSADHVTNINMSDSISKKRSRVNMLISNIPHKSLPFKLFNELYKFNYKSSITIGDLKRMSDIMLVSENSSGPILLFRRANIQQKKDKPSHAPSAQATELPVSRPCCHIHDTVTNDEHELMFVYSSFSELNTNIVTLLLNHEGTIPLASLPKCYASRFGSLSVDEDRGVPLEQLISFMSTVAIVSVGHYKIIKLKSKTHQEKDPKTLWNPLLATQLNILCNETVELLKTVPSHRIHFNQFNAAYYDHFSRHCKVSDFGYNRLVDLFEAMSHVVQVLGEGTHRYLTLSHQIFINRFKSDVMRLFKNQPNKQIALDSFADAFEKSVGKPFVAREYGLCELSDLLKCLTESKCIALNRVEGRDVIALPKKELSQEQLVKVKEFAAEALKLLKGAPRYRMLLSKFIPAYHTAFGKQCKLSNYGCSKLAELFDHIPDTLELVDVKNSNEKVVSLKLALRLETLGGQLVELVKKSTGQLSVLVDTLPDVFRISYGFFLDPRDFECGNIWELLDKLNHYVRVVRTDMGDELRLCYKLSAPLEKIRVFGLLSISSNGAMQLNDLLAEYKSTFFDDCQLDFNNTDSVKDLFVVDGDDEKTVKLCAISELGRLLLVLITEKGGRIPVNELEKQFVERFGWHITPTKYGHESVISVLAALWRIIGTRGKGAKKCVFVNEFLIDSLRSVVAKVNKTSNELLAKKSKEPTVLDTGAVQVKPVKRRIAAVFSDIPPNCL